MIQIVNPLFEKVKRDAAKYKQFKDKVPRLVGVEMQQHYTKSFDNEGFTDVSFEPWKDVLRRSDPESPEYKYPKTKDKNRHIRKILHGKGAARLAKSIFVKSANFVTGVIVGTRIGYGKFHNEGDKDSGGHLDKRQFMGKSAVMMRRVKLIIERTLNYLNFGSNY